jgi:2',3'-cyclic-nucleotide 2'-phosphodiesterase (5'-nucleotidase family)
VAVESSESQKAEAPDKNASTNDVNAGASHAFIEQYRETLSLAKAVPERAHSAVGNKEMPDLASVMISHSAKDGADKATALKQGTSEFVSSLSAGVAGTVVLSVGATYFTHNARALTIPLALAAGAVTKYGVKDAAEHLLLDAKDRTLKAQDLLWGGVDALAGIGASAVEGKVAKTIVTNVGYKALGADVAATTAYDAGKVITRDSLAWGTAVNTSRGMVGGATGAAAWSLPHRVADNWQAIKDDPGKGLGETLEAVGKDTAFGTVFGGALGVGGTLIGRHADVMGKIKAAASPEQNVYKLDTYHINDFHSNTEQLPRLKTMLDTRMAASRLTGNDSRFSVPGDVESGRVNFAFTEFGQVENQALMDMGATEITPGNHPYDAPGGRFDVPRYPAMMEPLLKEHPEVSLISSNLDVSSYDQYSRILKPYAVRDVETPWGTAKMASIGVTTDEGAIGDIKFKEPLPVVLSTIAKLKGEGVSIFQIHSHLGLGEDLKLAQGLVDNKVNVAGIIGAHSHDALPAPMWVGGKIPVVQAGHSGKWLGQLHLEITPDGSPVRYQSGSQLHIVDGNVAEDAPMRSWLDQNLSSINNLKNETYNSRAAAPYSLAGTRNRETQIGNLYADAVKAGLQSRLGAQAPDVVLVHSGGIRSGIEAGVELSRLDLANIVINAGNREGEKTELAMMNLNGNQLKDALEYGVRERVAQPKPGLLEQVKSLFVHQREELVDEPGNFVQVSDNVKYTYDASRPGLTPQGGGQRIVDLQIKDAQGNFQPVDPNKTYSVAARFHPLDKWTKYNMFGNKTIDQVQTELGVKPLPYSQVDMFGEFIAGKTLDPKVDGALTGRITDLTPESGGPTLKPGKSLFVAPLIAGQNQSDK